MTTRGLLVLLAMVAAGCVSLASQVPTRPPEGRSGADVVRDQAQCDAYGKSRPDHQGDHYQACMIARGYAANVDMDKLEWVVGMVQTLPHEPGVVMQDLAFCDARADSAKKADVITLTPEQEQSLVRQASSPMPSMTPQLRPNASRMLVACLSERGYAIVPWVRF